MIMMSMLAWEASYVIASSLDILIEHAIPTLGVRFDFNYRFDLNQVWANVKELRHALA